MRRAVSGRGAASPAPRTQSPSGAPSAADAGLLWGVRAALLAVLFIPLLVSANSMFPYIVGKALFARAAIEIAFGLWLILLIRNPAHRPAKSWVVIAFGGWLLVSLAAAFTGVSVTRSLWSSYERMQGVVDLAHWFAFALAAASAFRTLADWRLLFTVNAGVCGVISALGLARYYDLTDWALATVREGRIESLLGNATFLGAYTVVSLLLALGMLLQSVGRGRTASAPRDAGNRETRRARRARNRRADAGGGFDAEPWLRALWGASAALSFWAMWFTGSRGAMAGLLAGAAIFAGGYALWGASRRARRALLAGGAAALLAGGLTAGALLTNSVPSFLQPALDAAPTLQRLASFSTRETSILGRLEAFETAADAFAARPLLGWGPENYLVAWGLHSTFDEAVEIYDQAHNKALEALVTTGGVGLLAYLALWGAMGWALLRAARRRDGGDRMLVLGAAAAAAAYFTLNMFLFDSPVTAMLFAMLAAFAAREEGEARVARSEPRSAERAPRMDGDALPGAAGRLLSASAGRTLLVVLIGALTALLLLFSAFRPYAAAVDAARGDFSDSWSESESYFERAIAGFPPLANYPRVYMTRRALDSVGGLTDAEFDRVVDLVTLEGERALALEPRNWWIHANLAQFHQAASWRDARRLASARTHVDELLRLAPQTNFAAEIADQQERMEEELARQMGAAGAGG